MRMAVIDIIKRFFSSADAGFPEPTRLGKDRMAVCVQEAWQIAETMAGAMIAVIMHRVMHWLLASGEVKLWA